MDSEEIRISSDEESPDASSDTDSVDTDSSEWPRIGFRDEEPYVEPPARARSDIYIRVRNDCPLTAPAFSFTQDTIDFLSESHEGRRKLLKMGARVVEDHDDRKFCRTEVARVNQTFREDPDYQEQKTNSIFGNETRCFVRPTTALGNTRFVPTQGHRIYHRLHPERNMPINIYRGQFRPVDKHLFFHPEKAYEAPKTRILITPNLSFNGDETVPVYSDVSGETLDNLDIPDTLLYQYQDRNLVNLERLPELGSLIEMSKETTNQISCDCCKTINDAGHVTNCNDVGTCPCRRTNWDMGAFFQNKNSRPEMKLTSFDKILFHTTDKVYYNYMGYGCSHLCACQGKCTNNPFFLIEKRLIPFEIYRSDLKIGFRIRSPILIPAGTPLMEFTGELTNHCDRNSTNTCKLTYSYADKWVAFLKTQKFSDVYLEKLTQNSMKHDYYVNPKWWGNISKLTSHSCAANVEIVRIFQGSLSPAHCRLLMFSLVDIYPGMPISLDYGCQYFNRDLETSCLCRSFACRRDSCRTEIDGLNMLQIIQIVDNFNKSDIENWRKQQSSEA